MKNKNGFTLVEIISVVVILGVLALIAVPAVSGYITNSRKTNYSTTILSYLQTVKGDYDMGTYGDKIYDNELMIVPIKLVKLEKGGSTESPFGSYLYNKRRNPRTFRADHREQSQKERYRSILRFSEAGAYGIQRI